MVKGAHAQLLQVCGTRHQSSKVLARTTTTNTTGAATTKPLLLQNGNDQIEDVNTAFSYDTGTADRNIRLIRARNLFRDLCTPQIAYYAGDHCPSSGETLRTCRCLVCLQCHSSVLPEAGVRLQPKRFVLLRCRDTSNGDAMFTNANANGHCSWRICTVSKVPGVEREKELNYMN